jgi:hypothetical protein
MTYQSYSFVYEIKSFVSLVYLLPLRNLMICVIRSASCKAGVMYRMALRSFSLVDCSPVAGISKCSTY